MEEEKEIWSIISKSNYHKILKLLKGKFRTEKYTKRLSMQATDYNRQDLDTRIRITNGKVEIMQKKGEWKGDTRVEISVPLNCSHDDIFYAYKIIRNLLTGSNVETSIIQTENHIFENADYEIKLTHQFGKTDVYNYEIEVFNHAIDPKEIVKEFNIPINSPENTPEFWKEWSQKVNLQADLLSDKELLELIKRYC